MTEFVKSDDASIAEHARATEYKMVPAHKVGERFCAGWRPLSPMIAMTPPEKTVDTSGDK